MLWSINEGGFGQRECSVQLEAISSGGAMSLGICVVRYEIEFSSFVIVMNS